MRSITRLVSPVPQLPILENLNMKSKLQLFLTLVACVSFLAVQAVASDQIPGRPQSGPIAIVGATIHTVQGDVIERGVLMFEDGKITQIGNDLELSAGTEVIEAEGKHVYPGLIEAQSDLGLVEINSVRATLDYRETGSMNPNVRAAAAFNPDSEIIPVNRSNGILLAVTAPSGGTISGRSALMMLDGWTWEDMMLKPDVGMQISWPRRDDGVSELQEIFDQAKRYHAAVNSKASDQPRDLRLEAVARVLDGEMPIIVAADTINAITSAVAFAQKNNVALIIYGGYEAPKCADLLKLEDVPVIVSAVYQVPRHRHDAFDSAYTLPQRLKDAGIKFCISAGGRFGANGIRNLPYNAATAAAYGLSEEDALRSITLWPAEILGVADRVGSLSVGMDATLFIADGDILETPTQVERAFVQGRLVDLDNKHRQLYRKYSEKYERLEN